LADISNHLGIESGFLELIHGKLYPEFYTTGLSQHPYKFPEGIEPRIPKFFAFAGLRNTYNKGGGSQGLCLQQSMN
jgi:hypothetical protein